MPPNSTSENLHVELLLNLVYKEGMWLPRTHSLTTDAPLEEGGRGGTEGGLSRALWKEREKSRFTSKTTHTHLALFRF
jgi:hypothetical protein